MHQTGQLHFTFSLRHFCYWFVAEKASWLIPWPKPAWNSMKFYTIIQKLKPNSTHWRDHSLISTTMIGRRSLPVPVVKLWVPPRLTILHQSPVHTGESLRYCCGRWGIKCNSNSTEESSITKGTTCLWILRWDTAKKQQIWDSIIRPLLQLQICSFRSICNVKFFFLVSPSSIGLLKNRRSWKHDLERF